MYSLEDVMTNIIRYEGLDSRKRQCFAQLERNQEMQPYMYTFGVVGFASECHVLVDEEDVHSYLQSFTRLGWIEVDINTVPLTEGGFQKVMAFQDWLGGR